LLCGVVKEFSTEDFELPKERVLVGLLLRQIDDLVDDAHDVRGIVSAGIVVDRYVVVAK
jgi:hypothetical protein